VIFGPGSTVQSAISILICLFSIKAYSLYVPFREDEDDFLQEVTQWQLFMVLFAATLARVDTSGDSASDQTYLGWLFIAFVVPGYFIMAWQCVKTYLDGVYKALDEVDSWCGYILGCLGYKRKPSGSTWFKRGRDAKKPEMVLEMTSTNDGSIRIEQENPIIAAASKASEGKGPSKAAEARMDFGLGNHIDIYGVEEGKVAAAAEPEPMSAPDEEPVATAEEVPAEEKDEGEWEAYTDAEGRTYYLNSKTNETSWGEHDQLTWDRHEHEGAPYWYNRISRRTSWTDPALNLSGHIDIHVVEGEAVADE